MRLSVTEGLTVSLIAKHLYDFLPASGNNATSFPLAAAEAGVVDGWPLIKPSKLPGVVQLLTWTLENRRDRFGALMMAIVKQSISYRLNKPNPLTRTEVERLNHLLGGLRIKIPELHDEALLRALSESSYSTPAQEDISTKIDETTYRGLIQSLLDLSKLAPQPRGYAFEKFLLELFDAFKLAPRGSFKLRGEQLDGTFVLHHETYLLEAKWQNERTGSGELRSFAGKVSDKATWSRGLFISNSGFTQEGLESFGRGKPLILMDGLDLYETLERRLSLVDVLAKKVRRAAEIGKPFIAVRDL